MAAQIRSVRTNNPGNLKAPDEETGLRWWGKHGFVGLDKDGFAMFDTAQGGVSALEQQIKIDQGRDQTQEEFINKYVGAVADPQGTLNAQRNIPAVTGAPPDAALADISTDSLLRAITQSEGGKDSLQHFGLNRGNFLALDRGRGQQQQRREAEQLLPNRPDTPRKKAEAPPITPVATAAPEQGATSGVDLSAVDERLRMLNKLTGADIPVMRDRTATGATEDELSQRIIQDQNVELESVAQEIEEGPPVSPMPTSLKPGSATPPMDALAVNALFESAAPVPTRQDATAVEDVVEERITEAEQARPITEKIRREQATPILGEDVDEMPESEVDLNKYRDWYRQQPTIEEAQETETDEVAQEPIAASAPQKSLLQRLGGLIGDNPEVAAQIAQAAGGLMSNIAGGRARREAGEETDRRVARANLISALTGGRARPQVTAAQADEGGLLSRLGQITTAGGEIASGEMARRRAEGLQERGMGLKERQVDVMERRNEIMQSRINKEHEADLKAAEAALAEATGASYERVQDGIEKLNKATKIYEGGGYLDPTQGTKNLYGQMRVLWDDYDNDASPANVAAIFQVYQRFFDPATVREGDLRILQEAEGTFRQLQAQAERIVGEGGSLSSDTVEEMKRITDKVHDLQVRKAKDDVGAYVDAAIAPQDREATMQYYDKIFTLPPLMGAGGAAELTKALQSGEIVLD